MLSRAIRQKALCQPVCARAFGHKIKVANPVVDMDGDEMTKIIWKWIKDRVSAVLRFPIFILIFVNEPMTYLKLFAAHPPIPGP